MKTAGDVVGVSDGLTRRAGVRVPSTSKRQMVFLTLRWSNGGYTLAASVAILECLVANAWKVNRVSLLSSKDRESYEAVCCLLCRRIQVSYGN